VEIEILLDEAGRVRRRMFTLAELASETGLSDRTLRRFVELGLIDPLDAGELSFAGSVLPRIHRMLRLRSDLHLNYASLGLVVDLLERIDELERERRR
jgi:chaperone modulatory protein CbpM